MRGSDSNMKLTHQRMASRYNTTPESLNDWIEEQLECRGIDAVVYARYILSVLQEDSDSDEDGVVDVSRLCRQSLGLSSLKETLKPLKTNKWKHKRYLKQIATNNNNNNNEVTVGGGNGRCECWSHSEYCSHSAMNSDEERRLAVVQCLRSASEQEFGIESFVDELCAKLKDIKVLSETNELSLECKPDLNHNNGCKVSPKEQAMKYYAAFPALDDNCNENTTVPKVAATVTSDGPKCKDRSKWNGQKIIEFITGANTGADGEDTIQSALTTTTTVCPKPDATQNESLNDTGIDGSVEKKFIYCEDIESTVLSGNDGADTTLVVDCNREDNDKFERLVNKFNSNIASIWSKGDTSSSKTIDNIWSFDSSFSSTQSSATPSPKPNAIDFWSSMNITEISECLTGKRAPALLVDHLLSIPDIAWESSLLQSINAYTDDGFIDGNNDSVDDESIWCPNEEKCFVDTNTTTLQNHQKNSPFIEFNSNLFPNSKTSENDSSLHLSKLLAMASLLNKSNHRFSPTGDENLLTSPKTHFQPIRHDLMDESDEGSVADITDTDVNKLVICSDKCPNNGNHREPDDGLDFTVRPVSTSLGELASYMGPFDGLDVNRDDLLTSLPISEEMEFNNDVMSSEMSDKSTNTESEHQMEMKPKLKTIVENEPEYDLLHMINEVLRNGISEDDTVVNYCSALASSDDWYDSDVGDNCTDRPAHSPEKRLSWNCYWDTYDIGVNSGNKSHFNVKSNAINEEIGGEEMPNSYPLSQELSDNNPNDILDDVFGEELYFDESGHPNGSREECRECDEVVDEYYFPEENDFEYEETDGVYRECYYDSDCQIGCGNGSDLGNDILLQLKSGNTNASKRNQKPCSFFVEGKCKRSDCQYSHDIGSITCKYWETGFCFKAELCPFLHGYVDDECVVETPLSLSKKSYAIESESDFPSLALQPHSRHNTPNTSTPVELDARLLEQHLLDLRAKSLAAVNSGAGLSKQLPIAVFMKKKVKKRKDRNLQ